jgi:hypothetical protein
MWDERRQQVNLSQLARANERNLTHVKKLERFYAEKLKKLNEAKSLYANRSSLSNYNASVNQYLNQPSVESFLDSNSSFQMPSEFTVKQRAHTTLGFLKNPTNIAVSPAKTENSNQNLLKNRTKALLVENKRDYACTEKNVKFSSRPSSDLNKPAKPFLHSKSNLSLHPPGSRK